MWILYPPLILMASPYPFKRPKPFLCLTQTLSLLFITFFFFISASGFLLHLLHHFYLGLLGFLSRFSNMGMAAEAQFHVLAVDDSIIDRKLIERLLKTSSYQVTAVDSGSKALEFLGLIDEDHEQEDADIPSVSLKHLNQDLEVNLIITHYCMPGMTGYDLLRKIKESKSLKDIPVVIMSSENVPSRINRCLEEGAEEFFLKPVQMEDVSKLKPHLMRNKTTEDQPNINKRKGMEEENQSPERTKTKYNNSLEDVHLVVDL